MSYDLLGRAQKGAKNSPDWLILAVVCVAQFMVVLDVSVVNVALPAIKSSLGFSQTGLQWILNAYTLTFAGFLLLGGRAADLYGRKRVYLFGMALFTVSSLVGGLSNSQEMLVISRAVQGLGGAILSPATLTIITTTFTDPKARSKALGMWSAVAGAGGAVGALLGGILTQLVSWRWILFINVPVGVIAFVAAIVVITERRRVDSKAKLDLAGSFLVTFGLASLVYGLVNSSSYGWGSMSTILSFIFAAVGLVWFVVHEMRFAESPLMPMSMFKIRPVMGANVVMMAVGGSIFASWFFLSLYFQEVRGYSPIRTGLVFLPQTIAIIVGAQFSSRMLGRIGARKLLVAGTAISALGLVSMGMIGISSPYLSDILLPSILITLGAGLCFTPLAFAATSGVKAQDAGLASGLLNTSRQVGGAIGLAALATLATSVTDSYLLHHHGGALVSAAALTHGYAIALRVSAVVALAGTAATLLLPRHKQTGSENEANAKMERAEIAFD